MSVTLKPVLDSLGYSTPVQQRAMVKLLQASGAFGKVPGVDGILTDKQADAVLNNVTFNDLSQAATMLHDITQQHMLRPKGVDRNLCEDSEAYKQNRAELVQAMQDAGLVDNVKPAQKYYDHVLVMGATEGEVNKRLDTLKELWDQGVRFGKIHLLGNERKLNAAREESAGKRGPNGSESLIEMDMMEARYYAKSANWPKEMQDVRIFEVNTYNKADGRYANTRETVEAWHKTQPQQGEVLVLSSQPCVKYQDAATKAVLPRGFHVESVGAEAPRDTKVSVVMDAIARQIDVGYERLQERLKLRKPKLDAQLVLVDPKDVMVDAATYQFRSGGDAKTGVTEKGRYKAERWEPLLHGNPILLHEKLDGNVFVADGHHRLDLAKTLNAKGVGPGKLAAQVLREADGYTAKDVKIIAAYVNIAHGKTDVVDTAKVFKEAYSGGVNLDLLPPLQMDKGNLKMAFTMSKLSDNVLDAVKKGEVSAEIAAKLAERVPEDQGRQEKILGIIKQKLSSQEYTVTEPAKASNVQINIFNMNKDFQLTPGFVEKLMNKRADQNVMMGMGGK